MILRVSPELWRAEGAWRLECGASFRAVHPPRCVVMMQSLTFMRCFLVTASFLVGVWEGFSNQCLQGEESIFIVQQAERCTSDGLSQCVWFMGSSSIS